MRRLLLALGLLVAAVFASTEARAENCSVSTGYGKWSAVATLTGATWVGSPCTAGAADDFTVSGADIEITADIAVTTGSVTCSSGTLRINSGAGITYAGGTVGRAGLTVSSACTLYMDGVKVWEGRIGPATITYAVGPPQTATFTMMGGGSVTAATSATTDYLVFGDDDPASVTATVTSPIQVGTGPPTPGYYRPSYQKWTWWDLNAVAATTATINTNAYTNPGSLPGAGTSPFTGTRGPAVMAAITATIGRTQHGFMSTFSADVDTLTAGHAKPLLLTTDGDLGGQWVEVTSGACLGRTYKIAYVEANAILTDDVINVMGDAGECGATASIIIHYGWRYGDPVKIVRPAYVDGGDVARVDWKGGTIKANYARFVNLFPGLPTGNTYRCTICVYRTDATTQPTFAGSYMTNINVAFPGMMTTGNVTHGFILGNGDTAGTAYQYGTSTLDATGFVMDRWYMHDQKLEATSGNEGLQGITSHMATGLTATRQRFSRLGDDPILLLANNMGTTTDNQTFTVRQAWIDEGMSLSNSNQLVDMTIPTPGTTWANYSATISDVGGACCTDGGMTAAMFNATVDRVVSLGTNGTPGGIQIGPSATYSAPPINSGATNTLRDFIILGAGPTASNTHLAINGVATGGIFAGNISSTPHNVPMSNPYSLHNVFVQFGVSNTQGMLERFEPNTLNQATTITIGDSALLTSYVAGAVRLNDTTGGTAGVSSMESDSFNSSYAITRSVFGSNVPAGGLCDATCSTKTANERTLTADGITLLTTTPSAGGIGMGVAGEGTLEGARITNGCVETTASPLGDNVYGAARTASSFTTDDNGPNPALDLPLSAFVAQPGSTAVCGGLALPRMLGLKKWGLVHAMLGDGVNGHPEVLTTDANLIRSLKGGGGGGGPPYIGSGN